MKIKLENSFFDAVHLPKSSKDNAESIKKELAKDEERLGGRILEGFQIEKTAHDQDIINLVQAEISAFMKSINAQERQIPPQNIHLLAEGGTARLTGGEFEFGGHETVVNSVIVDRSKSDMQFALFAFHELLHNQEYKTADIQKRKNENTGVVTISRSQGIMMKDKHKESFFADYEEAIIGLLTIRFFEKIKSNPLLSYKGEELFHSRGHEIDQLNKLVEEIYQKNKDDFANTEEVLRLFINAQFKGEMLTLARILEKTFGKGGFRKTGQSPPVVFENFRF